MKLGLLRRLASVADRARAGTAQSAQRAFVTNAASPRLEGDFSAIPIHLSRSLENKLARAIETADPSAAAGYQNCAFQLKVEGTMYCFNVVPDDKKPGIYKLQAAALDK